MTTSCTEETIYWQWKGGFFGSSAIGHCANKTYRTIKCNYASAPAGIRECHDLKVRESISREQIQSCANCQQFIRIDPTFVVPHSRHWKGSEHGESWFRESLAPWQCNWAWIVSFWKLWENEAHSKRVEFSLFWKALQSTSYPINPIDEETNLEATEKFRESCLCLINSLEAVRWTVIRIWCFLQLGFDWPKVFDVRDSWINPSVALR